MPCRRCIGWCGRPRRKADGPVPFQHRSGQAQRRAVCIAAAAYRAGERLYSDYYGEISDYTKKGGVICSEIFLPPNAPKKFLDRATLWNAVEQTEKHPQAQLSYSFDVALQNEFSLEKNIALAREFVQRQFVAKGMIADLAVHVPDKEGGIPNPHFHVMTTMRPLNADGSFGAKQRREYVLDENGDRVRDENGNYVFNAVHTTDWHEPETLVAWREAWCNLVNAKFEEKGLDCRIDHRSYVRQGLDLIPTVHEGPNVRKMEAKGLATEKGQLNRWIRATNRLIADLKLKDQGAVGVACRGEGRAENAASDEFGRLPHCLSEPAQCQRLEQKGADRQPQMNSMASTTI